MVQVFRSAVTKEAPVTIGLGISARVRLPYADALARTVDALKVEGFGVLTEIDVRATLKKKLDVSFRPYRILGACNPRMAHQALLAEDKIGTMLPCNVVVQELESRKIEVSAVDPVASMQAIDNPNPAETAAKIRDTLREVIAEIGALGSSRAVHQAHWPTTKQAP